MLSRAWLWALITCSLGIALTFITLAILEAAPLAEAEADTIVSLEGPSGAIQVGDAFTVTIHITDVVDLYGAQARLAFSASHLQVVDADLTAAGVQIIPGECPLPDFVVLNAADNAVGAIEYAVTQLYPTPPVSGSCNLAYISFQAQQEGLTLVQFEELILSNPNGVSIPATFEDLQIEIVSSLPAMEPSAYIPIVLRGS